MGKYTEAKKLVWAYCEALEQAGADDVAQVMNQYMPAEYSYRGSYPHRELAGTQAVADTIWKPLKTALTGMQRRVDIFIGGNNEFDDEIWVLSMGHFMGLFDNDILGIRHTNKLASLRYSEFFHVQDGKITESALFVDWIGFMQMVGANPLPPTTGQYFVYPGPRMHDGIKFEDSDPAESKKTQDVVNDMIAFLRNLSASGSFRAPTPEEMAQSWSEKMLWYGAGGIGATYTIERYIKQHTGPFRASLADKKNFEHCVRFADGNFMGFFGWPRSMCARSIGGYMGMPSGDVIADMTIVDIYNRSGDVIAENWVTMDMPYWFAQQGLDVFGRTASILNV